MSTEGWETIYDCDTMTDLYNVFKYIVDNKNQAIVIAGVGQGKTYNSVKIAKELVNEGKVIYISHFLTTQDKFTKEFEEYGLSPLVYNSKLNQNEKNKILETKNGFIICTVEALLCHLDKFLDNCKLIIFDEFHLISEETYRSSYSGIQDLIDKCKFHNIPFIGLTATWYTDINDYKFYILMNNINTDFIDKLCYLDVVYTGLKSKINVRNWRFVQLDSLYLNAANHKKSGIIAGYIARILDTTEGCETTKSCNSIADCETIVDCETKGNYDHIIIYCNNKRIGLKLQEHYSTKGKDIKIICSDIKHAYYDYQYNNERFYEKVVNDDLSDYKLMYATESICAGLNLNSIKGNVLCINVVDGSNSIINAVQFTGRFRKADNIDVIQLTIPTKTPKSQRTTVLNNWNTIQTTFRQLNTMEQFVTNQYPNVSTGILDFTDVKPKKIKALKTNILRYFRIAKQFGVKVVKAFLEGVKRIKNSKNNHRLKNNRRLDYTSLLFKIILKIKGKKVNSRKYTDKELYSLNNDIRNKFLSAFKMIYTKISGIKHMYNSGNKTIYLIQPDKYNYIINNLNTIKNRPYKLLLEVLLSNKLDKKLDKNLDNNNLNYILYTNFKVMHQFTQPLQHLQYAFVNSNGVDKIVFKTPK